MDDHILAIYCVCHDDRVTMSQIGSTLNGAG
jgi:hypothetical protein